MSKYKAVQLVAGLCLFTMILAVAVPCLATNAPGDNREALKGYIYFADASGRFLTSVEHSFPAHQDTHERITRILDLLIQGPPPGYYPTLPGETRVNAVYVTEDGIAYIDMDETLRQNLPGGVTLELLAVYSIVNSIVLNIPEIKTVKLLIQGMDSRTLAGHIDLTAFFKANMLIIR